MSITPSKEAAIDYRSRIKTPSQALSYRKRPQAKHDAEMKLMERAFTGIPSSIKTFLDAPCGNGRMSLFLARRGYEVTGADLSDTTLEISREEASKRDLKVNFVKEDLEKMGFDDGAFDASLCFRFFHHLPNKEARRRVAGELCRVSRERIYVSYLSPWSPTSFRRLIKSRMGRPSMQQITFLSEVAGYFNQGGFRLEKDLAQQPLLRSLHLAIFVRR